MAQHQSKMIDLIKDISYEYDFPAELQFNQYREPSRQADVIQVFFRYSPFSETPTKEKFAFEIVWTDDLQQQTNDALISMKKREVRDSFEAMEAHWKNRFNFIFYEGVPYAKQIEKPEFKIKCELCDEMYTIEGEELYYRQDLYLCYALKEIDCDCKPQWEAPPVNADLVTAEGEHLPRMEDTTERFI